MACLSSVRGLNVKRQESLDLVLSQMWGTGKSSPELYAQGHEAERPKFVTLDVLSKEIKRPINYKMHSPCFRLGSIEDLFAEEVEL